MACFYYLSGDLLCTSEQHTMATHLTINYVQNIDVENTFYVNLNVWDSLCGGVAGAFDCVQEYASSKLPRSGGYGELGNFTNETCSPTMLDHLPAPEEFLCAHGPAMVYILIPASYPLLRKTEFYQRMFDNPFDTKAKWPFFGLCFGVYSFRAWMHFDLSALHAFINASQMRVWILLVGEFVHLMLPFASQVVLNSKKAIKSAMLWHNVFHVMLLVISVLTSKKGADSADIVVFLALGGMLFVLHRKINCYIANKLMCIKLAAVVLLCIEAASPVMNARNKACAFTLVRVLSNVLIASSVKLDSYNMFQNLTAQSDQTNASLEDAADSPHPARPLALPWK